jgi:hypothetical protein
MQFSDMEGKLHVKETPEQTTEVTDCEAKGIGWAQQWWIREN